VKLSQMSKTSKISAIFSGGANEVGKEKENKPPPARNVSKLTNAHYAAISRVNFRQSLLVNNLNVNRNKPTMVNQKYATLTRSSWSEAMENDD